jgi:hypothetical protein
MVHGKKFDCDIEFPSLSENQDNEIKNDSNKKYNNYNILCILSEIM